MKVGHSRFCVVARLNSRLSLTALNGGRVSAFDSCTVAAFSVLVLLVRICSF